MVIPYDLSIISRCVCRQAAIPCLLLWSWRGWRAPLSRARTITAPTLARLESHVELQTRGVSLQEHHHRRASPAHGPACPPAAAAAVQKSCRQCTGVGGSVGLRGVVAGGSSFGHQMVFLDFDIAFCSVALPHEMCRN